MNIEELNDKVARYKKSVETIDQKRQQWNDSVKRVIIDTLTTIVEQYPLPWSVQKNDTRKNSECVVLAFNEKPSGIVESCGQSKKAFIETGGRLEFQQLHNGDILVSIVYPYIDGIVYPNLESKFVRQIVPLDVEHSLIFQFVGHFLDDVTFWLNCADNAVGFRRNKINGG